MKVNLLAISGGFLGAVCIPMPWTVTSSDGVFGEVGDTATESAMTDFIHNDDSTFALAIVVSDTCGAR